jgi:tRNA (cmo5U34)-methyltransferase
MVLSEKIALPGNAQQELFEVLHHDFKRAMGYSDLEIAQKRAALDQVLIPDTVASHKERLHKAGFTEVYTWFQCLNFASWLAIK